MRRQRPCDARSPPRPSPAWKHFKGHPLPSLWILQLLPSLCTPTRSQADNGPLCSEREIITAKARCQGEARLCPITVWLKGCVSFRFFLSLYGQAAKHQPSPQSAQGTEVCFELGFHCLHSLPTHVWSDSIAVCSSEERGQGGREQRLRPQSSPTSPTA